MVLVMCMGSYRFRREGLSYSVDSLIVLSVVSNHFISSFCVCVGGGGG